MPGPFRYLFVDMNSYFASVEQQATPALRGRPVGVVPVMTDSTCCIAASYEAKAFGVRTGTNVAEARRLCPGIQFVVGRHHLYTKVHHRIIKAVESCLHVERVWSIDEMHGRLFSNEQSPAAAQRIAMNVKRTIRDAVGEHVRCSIGIAPNVWLAKIATEMQKPDGLVMLSNDELPGRLSELSLRDLPGIGRRMAIRLAGHGIMNIEQLWSQDEKQLQKIWGSRVLGSTWHAQMRGEALPLRPEHRRTVGHSHVLDPQMRTHELAHQVIIRMLHKAARRMRRLGYVAGAMAMSVRFEDGRRWQTHCKLPHVYDTLTLVHHATQRWPKYPIGTPKKVSVTLFDLTTAQSNGLPLFDLQRRMNTLADAMDRIATRYGRDAVYSGAMYAALGSAPTRIAFDQVPDGEEFDAKDEDYVDDASVDLITSMSCPSSCRWSARHFQGSDQTR